VIAAFTADSIAANALGESGRIFGTGAGFGPHQTSPATSRFYLLADQALELIRQGPGAARQIGGWPPRIFSRRGLGLDSPLLGTDRPSRRKAASARAAGSAWAFAAFHSRTRLCRPVPGDRRGRGPGALGVSHTAVHKHGGEQGPGLRGMVVGPVDRGDHCLRYGAHRRGARGRPRKRLRKLIDTLIAVKRRRAHGWIPKLFTAYGTLALDAKSRRQPPHIDEMIHLMSTIIADGVREGTVFAPVDPKAHGGPGARGAGSAYVPKFFITRSMPPSGATRPSTRCTKRSGSLVMDGLRAEKRSV